MIKTTKKRFKISLAKQAKPRAVGSCRRKRKEIVICYVRKGCKYWVLSLIDLLKAVAEVFIPSRPVRFHFSIARTFAERGRAVSAQ